MTLVCGGNAAMLQDVVVAVGRTAGHAWQAVTLFCLSVCVCVASTRSERAKKRRADLPLPTQQLRIIGLTEAEHKVWRNSKRAFKRFFSDTVGSA